MVGPGTVRDATRRQGAGDARGFGRLPRALSERFTLVREFDAQGAESDGFLLEADDGTLVFAKVYRRGINPKSEVLALLNSAAPEHVIQLIEAAQSDEGYWYELLEYAPLGTLTQLIAAEGPKLDESLVRQVLEEVADALAHVHELKIEHRDLKPDNVLMRAREPLDLVLTDFGIASRAEESIRHTSANRTIRYSPPEALAATVYRTRWDYWSLGMVLVEMLTGQHPLAGLSEAVVNSRLVTMATDDLVESVADPRWRKLCRGLLRREPTSRWDIEQIRRWLADPDDPTLTVAEEQAAQAAAPPFRFRGRAYHTAPELGAAFAAAWDDALTVWKSDFNRLFHWLRDDLGAIEAADALRAIDLRADGQADATMFSVIRILNPDGEPTYRSCPVTAEGLAEAADGAAGGDQASQVWLRALYAENILSVAGNLAEASGAGAAWNDAVADYRERAEKVSSETVGQIAAPELAPEQLSLLLAAATPGSEALASQRKRAAQAATPRARTRLWYAALGEPETAGPAAALLLSLLGEEAEGQVRAARDERISRTGALWGHMSAGAFAGLGVALIWGLSVTSFCSGGEEICQEMSWGYSSVGTIDYIVLGVILIAGFAILAQVHARVTNGR